MNFSRASGVLLHPTSLPGKYGIGNLGKEAFRFADFLADSGQTYWQMLPINPTGYGDSPYSSFSAFAGNTNLISPEKLVEDRLLTKQEINAKPKFPAEKVDYGKVFDYKNSLLKKAFERFRVTDDLEIADAFHRFCEQNAFWLEDYALFRAVRLAQNQVAWTEFEEALKKREPEALNDARKTLDEEIFAQKFYQFTFFKQWRALKDYCVEKSIKIVGDMPLFVAFDSADVWCNQSQFKLNEDGSAKVIAGVPPDYFSETGQLWGNPIYDWEQMRSDNFRWWRDRVRFSLELFDVLRIDHFRGFAACWEVPGGDATAQFGQWVDVPGRELFYALKNALGDLPFWAEDLGMITPDVEELRDLFEFPGMKILQFAFGGDASNGYLPHNYALNTAAYTGNHDNDTIQGWFASANEHERQFCLKYLQGERGEIHWDFIRGVWQSVANTAIVPMQDLLGLGSKSRMNFPGTSSGNWTWRSRETDFSKNLSARLLELTETYGRKN